MVLHSDLIKILDACLADLTGLSESVKSRQNLGRKPLEPYANDVITRIQRRIGREIGQKRKVKRSGYNARQRDLYRRKKGGVDDDGEQKTIKDRKVLGSYVRPRSKKRGSIR